MYKEHPTNSITTSAALEPGRLAALAGTTVGYCGAGGSPVGVVGRYTASGDVAPIIHLNGTPLVKVTADAAIAAGTVVYPAANGKVSATVAGSAVGQLLQASTADGDLVDMIPR